MTIVSKFLLSEFSSDSVKRASYRFVDIFAVDFDIVGNYLECRLNFLSAIPEEEMRHHENEFKIRVLDEDLREKIRAETSAVRNALLAYAFSNTGLQGNE